MITYPYPNFNGGLIDGLAETPLKLGHGWEITSHIEWLLSIEITIHAKMLHDLVIYISWSRNENIYHICSTSVLQLVTLFKKGEVS